MIQIQYPDHAKFEDRHLRFRLQKNKADSIYRGSAIYEVLYVVFLTDLPLAVVVYHIFFASRESWNKKSLFPFYFSTFPYFILYSFERDRCTRLDFLESGMIQFVFDITFQFSKAA